MFWIHVRTSDCYGCAVVELHGELDLAGAMAAGPLLMTVTASETVTILDLTELDFMDCSGLGVLVRARQQAGRSGHEMLLAAPAPMVKNILALTGADRQFPTYSSVAAAADRARVPESAAEHWRDSKPGLAVPQQGRLAWLSPLRPAARGCGVCGCGQG